MRCELKLKLHRRDKFHRRAIERRIHSNLRSRRKRAAFARGLPFGDKRPTSRIDAPYAMNIFNWNNRRTFCKFMETLRQNLLQKCSKIIISFDKTELITPSAMILFVAEIDRAKRIFGNRFDVRLANVRDRTIRQLLVQIGLYELCGMTPPNLNERDFQENVRHWRYATGERANESTNDAFAAVEGLISDRLRGGMWRGVSEAVINSVQHAYAEPRGVPGPRMKHRRWWMFTQERDGELTVVACDLGIGIPRSLPLNWDEKLLARILGMFGESGKDVAALKASLELGRTSTNKSHRGKGLPQIWDAVRGIEAGQNATIVIYSNKGRLSWNSIKNEENSIEYDTNIFGTVISWSVPLQIEGRE